MSDECTHPKSAVIDSRHSTSHAGWAAIARRRECVSCGARWSTIEIPAVEYEDLTRTYDDRSLRRRMNRIAKEIAAELQQRVAECLENAK